MTQSLNLALPSMHRISKNKPVRQPLQFKTSHTHARTSSVPSELPSYKQQKLTLNVLLDAIDLDQQMSKFFKSEVMKSKNRTTKDFVPPSIMMARQRSKSAPGAPPSYHYQRAFNTRWYIGKNTVTCESDAQQVAQLIVQKHIESAKNRE